MSFGFDIKSQKILGSVDPKEGKWSIAYEYESEDANLISTRGRLYLVVDFEGSAGIDLHLASKILIDSIKEHYFGDLEGTPLQALESSLVFGKDRLIEIINKEGVVGLNFNIASCVVWGSILYIAQVGTTSCLIIRNGEVVDISHKTSGEVMTSSGILETEDVVIIASKKFSEEFNNDELLSNLFNLESKFSQSSYAALLSAIIIRFKKNSLPSKKDLAGIVNLIKLPKRTENKKVEVFDTVSVPKSTIPKVEEKEPTVITSLVDGETGDSTELFPKSDTPLTHNILDSKLEHGDVKPEPKIISKNENTLGAKRGRKPKHLITGLFALALIIGLGFAGFNFFNKREIKKTPTVAYVSTDIDKYTKIYSELEKRDGTLGDYTGLLEKLQKSEVAKAEGYTTLVKNIENKINILKQRENKENDKYLIYDFSKKSSSVSLDKVSTNGKIILISDKTNKISYLVTEGKEVEVSDLAQSENYLNAFVDGDTLYFLDKDKVSYGTDVKKLKDLKIDKLLTESLDIYVYFDNVYSLNGDVVDKLTNSSTSYEYTQWKKLESSAKSIAIDGSIYITNSDSIEKYFKSEKQDFKIDPALKLSNPIIYTDVDMKNLYILSENKMYSVEKSTQKLVSTKELNSFTDIKSFTIGNSSIYLVTKTGLYKIPLK